MKMNEVLTSEDNFFKKSDRFYEEMMEFSQNIQIQIYVGREFIKIKAETTKEWTLKLHKQLCERFGLKLIRAEHLKLYDTSRRGYLDKIHYIYVDEQDTNYGELDFNRVKL